MFESSQNTIIKAKYFRLNKEQSLPSNYQLVPEPDDQQECFTPQFRGPQKLPDLQLLRKTDKLEKFVKIYDQYFKSTSTSNKHTIDFDSKNPQNYTNKSNLHKKKEPSQIYSTQKKYQNFLDVQPISITNSSYETSSKEFLFINSPLQSYSTPLDFGNTQLLLPNNAQILKHHIEKAKIETQKLKDEHLKLKLQKVKIAAKKSQNETMKLIPLKIQHQRLKKDIEKLIQEKEILEMNKRIKESSKPNQLKINGMEFKVLKHIPGTIYSQQELDQKDDSIEQSRVVKKASNSSFIQNNPPLSSYSNISLPSNQSQPIGNKSYEDFFQVSNTAQYPTYFGGNGVGIKKLSSNNDQSIRSINNVPEQVSRSLTGPSLIQAEMEKMKQNEVNHPQDQPSKSSFMIFAKASLKNGNSRPTFCKTPGLQLGQNSSIYSQGLTDGNKSAISNGLSQIGITQSTNSSGMLINRPATSTSHSPRTQTLNN